MSDEQGFAYPAIPITQLYGDEHLTDGASPLDVTVLDFWRWSSSDLVGNVSRGVLAEYLVARAVGATDAPRDPWAPYDVITPEGIKVEVKSAAYIQAWNQRAPSKISFMVRATRSMTGDPVRDAEPFRRSDVWVLSLLHHVDQATLNPLDVSQWCFFVVPTWFLDQRVRSQHSITLASLEASPFGTRHSWRELAGAIAEVGRSAPED